MLEECSAGNARVAHGWGDGEAERTMAVFTEMGKTGRN